MLYYTVIITKNALKRHLKDQLLNRGGSRDFHKRAQKIIVRPRTRARMVHGPLSGFFMLSGAIIMILIFKHFHTKWDKQDLVDQILGGRLLRPPLNPPVLNWGTDQQSMHLPIS